MSKGLGEAERDVLSVLASAAWMAAELPKTLSGRLPQFHRAAVSRAVQSLQRKGYVCLFFNTRRCVRGGSYCDIEITEKGRAAITGRPTPPVI